MIVPPSLGSDPVGFETVFVGSLCESQGSSAASARTDVGRKMGDTPGPAAGLHSFLVVFGWCGYGFVLGFSLSVSQ